MTSILCNSAAIFVELTKIAPILDGNYIDSYRLDLLLLILTSYVRQMI